jgi:primosomal protein N'
MIAHVIPYRRTPRKTDYFDYSIPDGLQVERGDTVWIPLRSQTIPGVVFRVSQNGNVAKLKSLTKKTQQQYWNRPGRMDLLEWFASYYGVSLATAWKTIQFPLLQRPQSVDLDIVSRVDASITAKDLDTNSILLTNSADAEMKAYAEYATNGKTLIIVPEYNRAQHIRDTLAHPRVIAFADDPSPSVYSQLVRDVQETEEPTVVVGTKKMLFLDIEWDRILIDQEHAKSHKQYDSNPRYDVRVVAGQLNCPILFASASPTMLASHHGWPILDRREAWNSDRATVVDMNAEYHNQNITWFSDELRERISAAQKSFLFLNRAGEYKIATCQDCDALLAPTAGECNECHGFNIRKHGKGVAALEQELRDSFKSKTVLRIDSSVDESMLTQEAIAQADIIIGTEKAFRLLDLSTLDLIGVLSVDHLLLYPHFQANERVWQLLTEMLCAGPPVLIQTHAPQNPVIQAAALNAVETFTTAELKMRAALRLPPYGPSIRLIDPKKGSTRMERAEIDFSTLESHILVDRVE